MVTTEGIMITKNYCIKYQIIIRTCDKSEVCTLMTYKPQASRIKAPIMLRLISSLFSQPKSTHYKFAGQLCRLKDYVYTLAMTRDSVLLTSGGNCPIGSLVKSNKCSIGPDGVRVWNVKTCGHMQVPHHSLAQRGAVHCVLWAKLPNKAHKMLFFGTGLGYLVMWTMSVSESVPIQGIILTVLNYI